MDIRDPDWPAYRDALLDGWDPFADVGEVRSYEEFQSNREAMATYDPIELAKHNGLNRLKVEKLELMMRDPQTRVIAEIAARHHLPTSEVRDRWSNEDIAYELALLTLQAIESSERCPSCGLVESDLFYEDTGREVPEPAWKIEWFSCPMCTDLARVEENAAKVAKSKGVEVPEGRYRWAPRKPGDEKIEMPEAHQQRGSRRDR